jgi:hypothetical protein
MRILVNYDYRRKALFLSLQPRNTLILNKNRFFLLLTAIVVSPFLFYKIIWLVNSRTATGTMSFVGKEYTGQIAHVYSVITFPANGKTFWFNGNDNILFKPGEKVDVRYLVNNPRDARIDIFVSIWGDTLIYGGIPALIILMIFFHPLIVPKGSKIRLSSSRPFVSITDNVQPESK